MKKLLFSTILILTLSFQSYSQGIYLRAGDGYGLPIATSSLGEKILRTSVSDANGTVYTNSLQVVKGSFGAGMNFNFAVGYKFNENFIIEINTQYLLGKKYTESDNYSNTSTGNTYVDNDNIVSSAKAFLLNPAFVFSAGFGKAAPYGRFGIVLGSPKVTGVESYYYDGDGISTRDRKWEYTKGLSIGFQGAIGMNWELSEKLDIFTELNYLSMTYYPGEYNLVQDISQYDNNPPSDNLPNMYIWNKKTIYRKKFDPTTANIDMAQPQTALQESFPFSAISAQVGIRFSIWNKSE
jgi:hypothetical protein